MMAITLDVIPSSLKYMAAPISINPIPMVAALVVTDILRYISGILTMPMTANRIDNVPMVLNPIIIQSIIFFSFFQIERISRRAQKCNQSHNHSNVQECGLIAVHTVNGDYANTCGQHQIQRNHPICKTRSFHKAYKYKQYGKSQSR